MPTRNFTNRPDVFPAVKWTGEDASEIEDLVALHEKFTCTLVGDTWTIEGAAWTTFQVELGQWLVIMYNGYAAYVYTEEDLYAQYSEVPGASPFAYTVTGS